jgi:nucleoside-diphosphate-sugar epimerase
MKKRILFTGISGFIGRNTVYHFIKRKYDITAIIRPKTNPERIKEFETIVRFVEIDLTDTEKLRKFLENESFDQIIHIGALRGGRNYSNEDFYAANVKSTEQFILNAQKNNSKFIFCSSVGVFGAIPKELPANELTERNEDNYYHFTKNQAEKLIQKYVLYGLNAIIIRPAITYGEGDYGFPYTLIKLVDKGLMIYPQKTIKIHMTNINTLSNAFLKASDRDIKSGTSYIVADKSPIELKDLIDFISMTLKNKKYPNNRQISLSFFRIGEKIAQFLKNELWVSRFQLISRSWYYDISRSVKELDLNSSLTIPAFKTVVEWYKRDEG